jgi:hypothetical protein
MRLLPTYPSEVQAMSSLEVMQRLNRALGERINRETIDNPHSPYAGKFVGIVNEQVVVVADTLDEMARRLREIEPDPRKVFWIEASRDYTRVERV